MQLPVSLYTVSLFITLLAIMLICVKLRKLTFPAALLAGVIGICVYLGAAENGIVILFTFFSIGVLATSHKKSMKLAIHHQTPDGPRDAGQVFANGGTAAILGFLAFIDRTHSSIYQTMLAASLASALADTLSSELGMVYGRQFYNILTLKRDEKGLDGVVSLEGTLIGVAGAGLIGLLFAGFNPLALVVAVAGILGNLTDSILGATLERKHYINNNVVNFMNTAFAALVALLLMGIHP
ncbi:MAG: DUF92 domain-containing protein [Pedobacter sp.]|nr:MAG: DUF92 domain-containing protein [Pedobacter sp.]